MVLSKRVLIFSLIITILPLMDSCKPQEARVNQKKIEKEKAKKARQAKADYDKAVKRHNKMQSKSTKASMKKTKKESQKVTPSMH
jgi:hypothetical protein